MCRDHSCPTPGVSGIVIDEVSTCSWRHCHLLLWQCTTSGSPLLCSQHRGLPPPAQLRNNGQRWRAISRATWPFRWRTALDSLHHPDEVFSDWIAVFFGSCQHCKQRGNSSRVSSNMAFISGIGKASEGRNRTSSCIGLAEFRATGSLTACSLLLQCILRWDGTRTNVRSSIYLE